MVVVFGAERITFEIFRVLAEAGDDVHVIVNEWEAHRIEKLAASIGATTSPGYYGYAMERRALAPRRVVGLGWSILKTSAGLLREVRERGATHVFVPHYVTALRNAPALVVLRARGVRVVLRAATAPDRGRFYAFLWRWILPALATTIVVQSEFTAGRCREVGVSERKLELIRNTIPRRDIGPDADRDVIALCRRRRTLLTVGQIAPFKGIHLAVEATLELVERGEDVQLLVAGRIPEWPPAYVSYVEDMKRRIATSPHADRVHFVGSVENVSSLMKESYLLMAPYLGEESFGIVVLEAMSSGLPVVTFPLGAVPELVVHEETGFLCDGTDRDALLRGVDYFLADSRRRDGAAAASLALFRDPANDTSRDAFARAWRRLFSKSLAGG